MLTGFCARKKQVESEEDINSEDKLEIDYYNYCYFYNNENRYDIKYMPLVQEENGEKIYMSYDKLRQTIVNMRKEDVPIKIFDSKKEYMKYISYYGLISAEWKLINEINVSENYLEKYFKANKTSRKLIENFLINTFFAISGFLPHMFCSKNSCILSNGITSRLSYRSVWTAPGIARNSLLSAYALSFTIAWKASLPK